MNKFNAWRKKIARVIIETDLPLTRTLYRWIMPKEDLKEFDNMMKELTIGVRRSTSKITELITQYPELGLWLNPNMGATIPGGNLVLGDAITTFGASYGYDKLPVYFREYVFDHDTFSASMSFFFDIPNIMQRYGYYNRDTQQFVGEVTEESMVALNQILLNHLSRVLLKAAPGEWEEQELIDQLHAMLPWVITYA